MIGHRGLGRGNVFYNNMYYKENTINSIIKVAELGIEKIETDVVRTLDDKLVLHHDLIVENDLIISYITENEAKSVGLDSLSDLFLNLDPAIGCIVEVKHSIEDIYRLENSTAMITKNALIDEYNKNKREMITYGFDASTAIKINSFSPLPIGRGFILEGGSDFAGMILTAKKLGVEYVSAHVSSLLGERAERQMYPYGIEKMLITAKENNIKTIAWCPDFTESEILLAKGVDYICVDNSFIFL